MCNPRTTVVSLPCRSLVGFMPPGLQASDLADRPVTHADRRVELIETDSPHGVIRILKADPAIRTVEHHQSVEGHHQFKEIIMLAHLSVAVLSLLPTTDALVLKDGVVS